MKKSILLLAFLTSFAYADTNPSNSLKLGDGTASNKRVIFNIGSGASNPVVEWNNSTSQMSWSNNGSTFTPFLPGLLNSQKGDLTTYSTQNAVQHVGSDGTVLTADSTQTNGIKWAAPSSAPSTVIASYYASANAGISSTQSANYDTRITDSNSAVTASAPGTGTWKFTAPFTGQYEVIVFMTWNSTPTSTSISVYKNGSFFQTIGFSVTGQGGYFSGSLAVPLTAADYIDVRTSTSLTINGGALSTSPGSIQIFQIH